MTIPMELVSSSSIASIGYDAEKKLAYVQFLDASLYAYKGVPQNEFDNLKSAPSVGSYFNQKFRNVYPSERVQV